MLGGKREEDAAKPAAHSYQSYDPLSAEQNRLTGTGAGGGFQKVYVPAAGGARKASSYSLPSVHSSFGKALGGYSTIGDDDSDRASSVDKSSQPLWERRGLRLSLALAMLCLGVWGSTAALYTAPVKPARLYGAWSSMAEPFSFLDPQVPNYLTRLRSLPSPLLTHRRR